MRQNFRYQHPPRSMHLRGIGAYPGVPPGMPAAPGAYMPAPMPAQAPNHGPCEGQKPCVDYTIEQAKALSLIPASSVLIAFALGGFIGWAIGREQ